LGQSLEWAAVAFAAFLLVSGIDDLFLCLAYFLGRRKYERCTPLPGPDTPEKAIAIWVPAWDESAVIEGMLVNNASSIRYGRLVFFVGVYPNDVRTLAAVQSAASRYRNIVPCLVPHDGPTSKGDCLNWVYQRMLLWEQDHGESFDLVLMHDAEDVIHPDELSWVNALSDRYAMVQTPVLAMPVGSGHDTWIYRTYCDDFAYFHSIELPARWMLGGFIPSSGVGTAYRRDIIERLASESNRIFLPDALTEDYENGLRVASFRMPQLFAPMRRGRAGDWVATREYFPSKFTAARRQRTRWITGIGLQAWERNGWQWRHLYWFWRDRKGLVGNPFSLIANLILAVNLVSWLTRPHGAGWLFGLASVPAWLLSVTLTVALVQCAVRIWAVGRIYGWRMGVASAPRVILGNVLNSICGLAAIRQYVAARLANRPLRWVKTEHFYPSPMALQANRRRLGEILVEMALVSPVDIERAVAGKPEGVRLGEFLVGNDVITEVQLYHALGLQTGIEAGPLEPAALSPRLSRLVPAGLVRKHRALPFAIDRGSLQVAVAEVPDEELTGALGSHLRMPVRFRLTPYGPLAKFIDEISFTVNDL
jgi:adsorption protein B